MPVIETSLNGKRTEESSSDEHSAEESDEEVIQELTEEEIPANIIGGYCSRVSV